MRVGTETLKIPFCQCGLLSNNWAGLATIARQWSEPSAMASTFVRPLGTSFRPPPLLPQATTVPSDLSARLCPALAATVTTPVALLGGCVWPYTLVPHATTVPSDLAARL